MVLHEWCLSLYANSFICFYKPSNDRKEKGLLRLWNEMTAHPLHSYDCILLFFSPFLTFACKTPSTNAVNCSNVGRGGSTSCGIINATAHYRFALESTHTGVNWKCLIAATMATEMPASLIFMENCISISCTAHFCLVFESVTERGDPCVFVWTFTLPRRRAIPLYIHKQNGDNKLRLVYINDWVYLSLIWLCLFSVFSESVDRLRARLRISWAANL